MTRKTANEKTIAEATEAIVPETEFTQDPVQIRDEKPKKEQLIYVGPSLPGGFLAQHTVFRDGLPKYLEDIRKNNPQLDVLIVPVSQLLDAQEQLGCKGTAVQQAFQALSRKEQANGN